MLHAFVTEQFSCKGLCLHHFSCQNDLPERVLAICLFLDSDGHLYGSGKLEEEADLWMAALPKQIVCADPKPHPRAGP